MVLNPCSDLIGEKFLNFACDCWVLLQFDFVLDYNINKVHKMQSNTLSNRKLLPWIGFHSPGFDLILSTIGKSPTSKKEKHWIITNFINVER